MATFRRVFFWPPTKFLEAAWHEDPDQAAWLGTSRRVCEAYSVGLVALGLTGRSSELRVMTEGSSSVGPVTGVVNVDRFEGFEFGRVYVPRGTAALTPGLRAGLVLETVHQLVLTLGLSRGWDAGALTALRDQVAAEGCDSRWASAWKSSPGRSRRARATYRLADDGNARVVLEVAEREDAVTSVGPAYGAGSVEGMKRSASTLRWHGKDTVEVVPWVGFLGDQRGRLRWESGSTVSDLAASAEPEPTPIEPVPDLVAVRPDGGDRPPERRPQIRVVGGGPTNGVRGPYLFTLYDLLDVVKDEAWRAWWARSAGPVLASAAPVTG